MIHILGVSISIFQLYAMISLQLLAIAGIVVAWKNKSNENIVLPTLTIGVVCQFFLMIWMASTT